MRSLQPLENGRDIYDERKNRGMNELLAAIHSSHWPESGGNRWPKLQHSLSHAFLNGYILFNALVTWLAFLVLAGNI